MFDFYAKFAEIDILGFVMPLNIDKCKELLKHCKSGNVPEVIALLSRDDVDVNYVPKVTRSTVFDKNAISYAAATGHAEIVGLLLANGANANCHYEYKNSPLYQAIANRHASAALVIIHKGKLNFHEVHLMLRGLDLMGGIVTRHALQNELFEVVIGLLQAGACTTPVGLVKHPYLYREILSNLVGQGDVSVARELIANHKSTWENQSGVYYHICTMAKPEVVNEFVESDGRFNDFSRSFFRSLRPINRGTLDDTLSVRKIFLEKICTVRIHDLSWIFPGNESEDLSNFLAHDSDINLRGALGLTPLMVAVQLGDKALVVRMIEAGADITATNDFGGNVLTMAVRADDEMVVETLVSVVRHRLFLDAVVNNDVETVHELVELRQVDVNHADENGKNALMLACEQGNLKMAQVVLGDMKWTFDRSKKHWSVAPVGLCADINAKDKNGNTALAKSCENTKNAAVEFLLNIGADVNVTNIDGDSALTLCCKMGNIAGAELLLLNGANVNIQNAEGNTPLMICCFNKNTEMVNLLVSGIQRTVILFGNNGKAKNYCANLLDIDLRNNAGQTALMLSHIGEPNAEIINCVLSADPKDIGPFDSHGREISLDLVSFDEADDRGYDDLAVAVKKPRTALLLKDDDDELQAMDGQQEVQLPPLADFLASHTDAAPNAGDEALAIASPSYGALW